MGFGEYVSGHFATLALNAYQHASAVVQAMVLAAAIGVLLGVSVYRSPIGSAVATTLTSAILTVPAFALLGLLIPVLGLGVAPTMVALVLYALLPVVRNTIVGLDSIDPAITSAAQGIGMSRTGVLSRIELRLAWPSILAGMRVSTQMLMGIAAIAAYAKGPGLGSNIFSGLAQVGSVNAVNNVLAGVLGIVVLALVLDGLLVLIGRLTISRGIRG